MDATEVAQALIEESPTSRRLSWNQTQRLLRLSKGLPKKVGGFKSYGLGSKGSGQHIEEGRGRYWTGQVCFLWRVTLRCPNDDYGYFQIKAQSYKRGVEVPGGKKNPKGGAVVL